MLVTKMSQYASAIESILSDYTVHMSVVVTFSTRIKRMLQNSLFVAGVTVIRSILISDKCFMIWPQGERMLVMFLHSSLWR